MTRKTNAHCPYCHAAQTHDKIHTRFYACDTTADRQTGQYQKKCKALDTTERAC